MVEAAIVAESMAVEITGIARERVMERADISAMSVSVLIRVIEATVTIVTITIRIRVVFVMVLVIWVEVREAWVEVIIVDAVGNWIVVKAFIAMFSSMNCFTTTIIIILGEMSFDAWVLESVILWIWHVVELLVMSIVTHVKLNSLGGGKKSSSEVSLHGYSINFQDLFTFS